MWVSVSIWRKNKKCWEFYHFLGCHLHLHWWGRWVQPGGIPLHCCGHHLPHSLGHSSPKLEIPVQTAKMLSLFRYRNHPSKELKVWLFHGYNKLVKYSFIKWPESKFPNFIPLVCPFTFLNIYLFKIKARTSLKLWWGVFRNWSMMFCT